MENKYFVYMLLDYKGKYFYIGITKNLDVRINEHIKCKGNNPAKNYRIRRCIEHSGGLKYHHESFPTLAMAREHERKMIKLFYHQLVNVQHGKNTSKSARKRKAGRSKQCPTCGNWFKRINAHKCKFEET